MTMHARRLRRLLAAYGADPRRWPEAEVPGAEALLRSSSQALQREARALDARLDGHRVPALDPALLERTLARAAELEQERPRPRLLWLGAWPRPVWPQLAALAGAAVLGLIVGWSDLLPPPADPAPDAIALTLLDGLE